MSLKNAKASNWVAERAGSTSSAFKLKGTKKGYASFSRAFAPGETVFYSAHDEIGNREAGYGVFDGSSTITRNPTATLSNNVYTSNLPHKINFSGEVTVACTFNAAAFNTLWAALDGMGHDGDGGINIPPELIEGLVETLNGKADQVDLDQEIRDRIAGDQDLQGQIDAIEPGGDGAGMVISADEPSDPETGLQWLEASTGRVWIWDDGKWLEFPAAVPEVEGGGFIDAPNDGKLYGRQSEDWAEVVIPDAADPDWSDVQNKPAEFPPASHTHLVEDITDFDPADYQPKGDYIGEAPNDGKQYVRESKAWTEVVASDSGAPAMHFGDTAPADPVEGMQWLNTDDGYLYVYYDNAGDPTWMSVEREA